MLQVNEFIQIPLSDFEFSFARSSGPGGQNVNKVNSKVFLRWYVIESDYLNEDVKQRFIERYQNRIHADGSVMLISDRHRDQAKNIEDCLEKLKMMILEVALPPKKRKKTKPTRGSKERRIQSKKRRSETKAFRRRVD